jgi:predicted amino acid racemase
VLNQECPLSQAREVARFFSRSCHSEAETLRALNQAAGEWGLPHGVLLTLDLGEHRARIPPAELAPLLEYALSLRHLTVEGFAFSMGCQGQCIPDAGLLRTITDIREAFRAKGVANAAVSIGGSIFCRWMEEFAPESVSEIRLGANFILGVDTYRKQSLPGGPFRSDVCLLLGEILEITRRDFPPGQTTALSELDGFPVMQSSVFGKRLCALLDVGRVHAKLEELVCALPGARIANISSNSLVLDVTDCPVAPHVGQQVPFRLGYWSIARLFHSFSVPVVAVRDNSPELAFAAGGALP